MTLANRLRLSLLVALLAATAVVVLMATTDPNGSSWSVLSGMFLAVYLMVGGFYLFFAFRIRRKFAQSLSSIQLWWMTFRQALLLGLIVTLALALAALRLATGLNLILLAIFAITLELLARRRKAHLEVVDE